MTCDDMLKQARAGRSTAMARYEEGQADAIIPQSVMQEALSLAGAWHDLDWDTVEQALHRIRHESPPSPSLAL
jgi:hypothetical protein